MSTWYTAHFGSWNTPEGVRRIGGTFSRKEIFSKAQEAANEYNAVVSVIGETGSPRGLITKVYKVTPM